MIGGMRKFAKSKWALVVLFIPLVISLALFLPDNFGGGLAGGTVSRIGGREIKTLEIDRDMQQALERLFPNRKDPMRRCGTLRNFTRQGLSSPAICKQSSGHAAPAHSPQHSTPPCRLSLQPQKGAG